MKYGYLSVEGQDDLEYVGCFFREAALVKVQQLTELKDFWRPLVPREFPYNGDLNRRIPVPAFFQNATHAIAVYAAGNWAAMVSSMADSLKLLHETPTAIGVVSNEWKNVMPTV